MPQTLNCPRCNAPVSYAGGEDPVLPCPFCGASIIVPESLRTAGGAGPKVVSLDGAGDMGEMLQRALQMAPQLKEIAAQARSGNKIEAIKLYRAAFGVGLAEANQAVEKMAAGQVALQFNSLTTSANAPAGLTAEHLARIRGFIEAGSKIEAIKVFRQATGVGLKEAKDAVEAMAAAGNFDASAITFTATTTDAGDIRSAQMLAVQTLIGMGKKIEAIKVYRQLTGVGLKEAKDAVEAMAAGGSAPAALPMASTTPDPAAFSIPPSSTLNFPQSPSVVSPEQSGGRSCMVWGGVLFALLLVLAALGAAALLYFNLAR